jgi:hypothetical protein
MVGINYEYRRSVPLANGRNVLSVRSVPYFAVTSLKGRHAPPAPWRRREGVIRRKDAFARPRSICLISRETQARQEKLALLRDPQVIRRWHHNGCDGT